MGKLKKPKKTLRLCNFLTEANFGKLFYHDVHLAPHYKWYKIMYRGPEHPVYVCVYPFVAYRRRP